MYTELTRYETAISPLDVLIPSEAHHFGQNFSRTPLTTITVMPCIQESNLRLIVVAQRVKLLTSNFIISIQIGSIRRREAAVSCLRANYQKLTIIHWIKRFDEGVWRRDIGKMSE